MSSFKYNSLMYDIKDVSQVVFGGEESEPITDVQRKDLEPIAAEQSAELETNTDIQSWDGADKVIYGAEKRVTGFDENVGVSVEITEQVLKAKDRDTGDYTVKQYLNFLWEDGIEFNLDLNHNEAYGTLTHELFTEAQSVFIARRMLRAMIAVGKGRVTNPDTFDTSKLEKFANEQPEFDEFFDKIVIDDLQDSAVEGDDIIREDVYQKVMEHPNIRRIVRRMLRGSKEYRDDVYAGMIGRVSKRFGITPSEVEMLVDRRIHERMHSES